MRKPRMKPGPSIVSAVEKQIEALNYMLNVAARQGYHFDLYLVRSMGDDPTRIEVGEVTVPAD